MQGEHGVSLKELSSGSPDVSHHHLSRVQAESCCCSQDLPAHLFAVPIIFAAGVTIALILQIHLNASLAEVGRVAKKCTQVKVLPLLSHLLNTAALQVFLKGVVSDHERCTALGERVLGDRGSSVDAAIAGALCLGVMHPHVSGVGGGGVMLVHDIRRNETKVINFQGAAPETFKEEMLQNGSEIKAGLLVGVPGMLLGLHRAHSLYGSLSWEDVVSRAAHVAREGFNVSLSLADAISKVKGERLQERFRNVFVPGGRALSPGSYVRMPGLAQVLQAGLHSFYHGELLQEMEDEVRGNGGVLSREDISNYDVETQDPLESPYHDLIVQVPPPPSAGAALITALNLLEGFHFRENNVTENQIHRWINESLTAALALASGLGDPKANSSVTELLSVMLSKHQAEVLRQKMIHSQTSPSDPHSLPPELLTGQVVVMGPDNLVVSVASSLSRPFGSRILTRSGILLNGLVLHSSWPNGSSQDTGVQPGPRPLAFLMPSVLVPVRDKCGPYMALSSSGGPNRLSKVIQV
ncbi:glutathione hydrolase 7-like [Cololabis saira]|uniref:glutathione hydrolase 7-like n=1 Tax=Cololabis saira TaxID=129043 RepID=UPI002AD541EC|nr:glutathione hydrolase 7-like [Cololabis saira]